MSGPRSLALRPVPVWVLTRALLVVLLIWPASAHARLVGDPAIYHHWARLFVSGGFPAGDARWQYPPGAIGVLLLPLALPGGYLAGLVLLMLCCDALATLALAWRASRGRASHRGMWAWVLLLPCAGPVVLARFDLAPAALAVAAAAVASSAAVGALVAAGALVKVWPVVLAGLPLRRRRRPVHGLAGAAGVVALAAAGLAGAGLLGVSVRSFVDHQDSRGLQIESLVAYPAMLAAAVRSRPPADRYRDGAVQLTGHASAAHDAALAAAAVLAVTVLASLLAARRGAPAGALLDLAFAGLAVILACAEVLSPQYLVWLVAAAAAATSRRASRMGPVLVPLAVAALLTAVVFPYLYGGYERAQLLPVVLEGLRDLALLAVAVLAVARAPWWLVGHPGATSDREGSH